MIDLTPLDVRKKRGDFRRILRGYDPEEVDTFMDLVSERLEELVRENLALSEKTGNLERQLESLVGREKAVQEALVSAQKLREDVKGQSEREAEIVKGQATREVELLKAEAEAEIQRRLGEAEGLIRERQRAMEDLERSRLKFLKSFRGLLERELDAVEVEEARRPLEETPLELEFRGWMPGKAAAKEEAIARGEGGEPEPEADRQAADEKAMARGKGSEPEPEAEADVPRMEEVAEAVAEAVPIEAAGPANELPSVEEAVAVEELGPQEDIPSEAEAEPAPEPEPPESAPGPDAFETQVLDTAVPVGIEDLAPAEFMKGSGDAVPGDGAREAQPDDSGPGEAGLEDPAQEEADLELAGPGNAGPEDAGPEKTGFGNAGTENAGPEDDSSVPEDPKWLFSLLKREEEKGAEE